MAYGLVVTVPAPVEVYEATHAEIMRESGGVPAEGLLVHYARQTADGFQIVELWTSKEASDRFGEQVVAPVVERLAAARSAPAPQPVREEFETLGLLTGAAGIPAARAGGDARQPEGARPV